MPHHCVGGACFSLPCCRERQHVSRVVLGAKVAIQAPQLRIASYQYIERAALANFLLQRAGEALDRRPPQTCGDATEPDATAFGRRHGARPASGSVSWRPAPMASL